MHSICPFYSVWLFRGIFICEGMLTHIMLQVFTFNTYLCPLNLYHNGRREKVVEAMKIYKICMQGSCEFYKPSRLYIDMRV